MRATSLQHPEERADAEHQGRGVDVGEREQVAPRAKGLRAGRLVRQAASLPTLLHHDLAAMS